MVRQVDFEDLRPPDGATAIIPSAEYRGITIAQLGKLEAHATARLARGEAWFGSRATKTGKLQIVAQTDVATINFCASRAHIRMTRLNGSPVASRLPLPSACLDAHGTDAPLASRAVWPSR